VKPAPFDYVAPCSLDEALDVLSRADDETKILAGGQSLIPLLNMRLASPKRLVDLGQVAELRYVVERDGGYAIGAMTRQRALERDPRIAADLPLLAEAISYVGHPQIRNRGTLGGSIAHGDPAAELPAVAVCLGARVAIRGPRGSRTISASDLYLGYLATTLAPDELLAEVWFPRAAANMGTAWLEFARRHGDYAIAGIGVSVALDGDTVAGTRIVATGVGGTPIRASAAEALLVGAAVDGQHRIDPVRQRRAIDALRDTLDPATDVQATADYRRHLAGVLTDRALRIACERALPRSGDRP
jgi:carbon-monoxide dehydrogenase medium subunit